MTEHTVDITGQAIPGTLAAFAERYRAARVAWNESVSLAEAAWTWRDGPDKTKAIMGVETHRIATIQAADELAIAVLERNEAAVHEVPKNAEFNDQPFVTIARRLSLLDLGRSLMPAGRLGDLVNEMLIEVARVARTATHSQGDGFLEIRVVQPIERTHPSTPIE